MCEKLEVMLEWFKIFYSRQYIYAPVPVAGKPNWKTAPYNEALNLQELYDRWKAPDSLIGTRFWQETRYLLLDIDKGSAYHPYQNEGEFRAILRSLEQIGLCRYLIVQSSDSLGLHIYFPLPQPFQLWRIALLVRITLEQADFEIKSGQLESFPNYIPFIPDIKKPLYNAHRLPLQANSYLLNDNFLFISSDLLTLIRQWQFAAEGQDLEKLQYEIKCVKPPRTTVNNEGVKEWRERLETTIKTGWTGNRQTQILSKAACAYGRVFLGLGWKQLEDYVLATLTNAPGYKQFCRHQRNIQRVVRAWIKTNRNSGYYYPLFSRQVKLHKPKAGFSNSEKREEAIRKIKSAITQIVDEEGKLPKGNTAMIERLNEITRCSFSTLYKHRNLWESQMVESCVIADETENSAAQENTTEPQGIEESCVIPCCSKVSTECDSVYKTDEAQGQQGITHDSLLSIYISSS